jgi:mannan endo-1,4-beta-mannosidase
MPDIEPEQVGTYDDTQLKAIDQLMIEAHARGMAHLLPYRHHQLTQHTDIKLTIAIHDRYQLGCWGNDTYVSKYHLPAVDCNTAKASDNNVEFWYSDANCINDFDNRIAHVLEHSNDLLPNSPKWKDLADYIFSFNIQNEGQGHLNDNVAPHPSWWCDRATFMRGLMGDSKVRISTGNPNPPP